MDRRSFLKTLIVASFAAPLVRPACPHLEWVHPKGGSCVCVQCGAKDDLA